MTTIKIEGREIGRGFSPYIIAEMSANHNGNLDTAFKIIEAAGGLVQNTKNDLLIIERLGKLDLPKGKIEKNESKAQAACREVLEETGVEVTIKPSNYQLTHHLYQDFDGVWVWKVTYWFDMRAVHDKQTLKPQGEEGISQVFWIPKNRIDWFLEMTIFLVYQVLEP